MSLWPRKRKFNNKPVVSDGQKFDSTSEFVRWCELRLLEKAGEISNLRLHPKYPMIVNNVKICDFIPDYFYRDKDGTPVVEDRKGGAATQTPEFKLKAKLLRALHGVELRITGKGT